MRESVGYSVSPVAGWEAFGKDRKEDLWKRRVDDRVEGRVRLGAAGPDKRDHVAPKLFHNGQERLVVAVGVVLRLGTTRMRARIRAG